MYYSQFGEDKILSEIFKHKKNGFCIEIGANDGVNDSNTMYFENIGWDAVLVEPNPILCKNIRSLRKAQLYECAVTDKKGMATLYVAEGADRAHGVSTISGNKEALEKIESYGFTYKKVKVEAKTLDQILIESNHDGEIDFISIDVEGLEMNVLKGFSIEKWSPAIFIIEDNSNFQDLSIRDYLGKFEYVRFMRTGVNDWYANRSNKKLVNFYSVSKYKWQVYKILSKDKWQVCEKKLRRLIKSVPGAVYVKRLFK